MRSCIKQFFHYCCFAKPNLSNSYSPVSCTPDSDQTEPAAAAPLQALLFDSFFDQYKGAIANIAVKQGQIQLGMYQ